MPDSYVVEVDGHRYHWNKCDLTLVPPSADSDDESESEGHQTDHDVPMARAVMPTLRPKPHLKFPKLPVQATQQKDFELFHYIYVLCKYEQLLDSQCKYGTLPYYNLLPANLTQIINN